jgi:hypothetical protein
MNIFVSSFQISIKLLSYIGDAVPLPWIEMTFPWKVTQFSDVVIKISF